MENEQPDNSNAMTERPAEVAGRFETFVRRLFERIGGALDFALRRPLNPQPRTDLTTIIPPIERAIEEKLRRVDSRIVAPNLIELRYDYETYSQLTKLRVEFLQRELRATIYEYIHNRRYATLGDVRVTVSFDVFTRGLAIKAQFPDEAKSASASSASTDQSTAEEKTDAVAAAPPKQAGIVLKAVTGSRFNSLRVALSSADAPAGIGRSRDNKINVNDSTVSSFHAAMTLSANGTITLSDLGSSNGTFVNGVQIASGERCIIRSGDHVRFGDVEFTIELNPV